MSVGFGFSVGDFIAALNLVGEVIDALKDSGDSSLACRQLLRQLLDLETALIQVRRLEFSDAHADQANALSHAALRCRVTIDEFMGKIQKYQPHLTSNGLTLGSSIKRSWYKVKWALCKQEDVEKFKADVVGHTEALNLLMNAIQIQQMTLESRDRKEQHSSLMTIIQSHFAKAMQKLAIISDLALTSVSNTKELLAMTTRTAQIDCKIFAVVLDVQERLRSTVAPQVLRNQPVYFVDALGIQSPFYLEFIRSKEAFLAVLRSNMQGHQSAVERINDGDFAISDISTNRDIDFSRPWQVLFRPGQRADMSMILNEQERSVSTCPSCKTECPGGNDEDVECSNCGLTYRRLTAMLDKAGEATSPDQHSSPSQQDKTTASFGPDCPSKKRKRSDMDDELMLYRKVRLRAPHLLQSDELNKLIGLGAWWGGSCRQPIRGRRWTVDIRLRLRVRKIEARYADQPDVYRKFSEILQQYQREARPLDEVYRRVVDLLGPSDLLDEFKTILPETSAIVDRADGRRVQEPVEEPPLGETFASQQAGDAEANPV